jgi:hypothetical protein
MMKRWIGLAIVVLAAWGSGCASAPAPEEPAQWQMIRFVPPDAAETAQDRASVPKSGPSR